MRPSIRPLEWSWCSASSSCAPASGATLPRLSPGHRQYVDTGATLLVAPRSLAERLALAVRRSQPGLFAGLCGFKPRQLAFLRREIGSFEHYWYIHRRLKLDGRWGCDQLMLRVALERHACRILDSSFRTAGALDLPVVTVTSDVYEAADLHDLPLDLLRICDQISSFPGQPQDDTRPALRRMLELDTPFVSMFRRVLAAFPEAARRFL